MTKQEKYIVALQKQNQEFTDEINRLRQEKAAIESQRKLEQLKIEAIEREFEKEITATKPLVKSSEDLIELLLRDKKSLCRYGDGEFELMQGNSRAWFQEKDDHLSQRLKDVFYSKDDNVVIAIANNFGRLEQYTTEAGFYIRDYLKDGVREKLLSLFENDRVYYDAYVSRPYLMYRDKNHGKKIFNLLKKLWLNRDILLVEGEYMRMGIQNDLFSEARSIRRIICPSTNAYAQYDNILNETIHYANKEDLILIGLGPTATVLAYDLAQKGYQALDIGQIDNEYEWMKMGTENREAISGKAVPERNDLHTVEDCLDEDYLNQIVCRIGKKTIKVSIVVPVYNVEQYLRDCLDSLIRQTLKEIEIICVNDGSTDSSPEILQEYARKDERILIINKANSGYGDTINQGFKVAKGKYVAILESDDFAEDTMYQKLYETAEANAADIVKCNFNSYNTEKNEKVLTEYLAGKEYNKVLEDDPTLVFLGPVIWGGIYRRSFLIQNNIWALPTPGASYQDTGFSYKALDASHRVVLIKDGLINYRIDNEASSVKDEGKIFCIVEELREIKKFLIERGEESRMPYFVRTKFYRYKWNFDRLTGGNRCKFLMIMHEEFLEDVENGYLQRNLWNVDDWVFVNRLIFDYPRLMEQLSSGIDPVGGMQQDIRKQTFNTLKKISDIYIYGAGKYAQKINGILARNEINIKGIVVTKEDTNKKNLFNVPVVSYKSIESKLHDALIIIGVSDKYYDEIEKKLADKGLYNYYDGRKILNWN